MMTHCITTMVGVFPSDACSYFSHGNAVIAQRKTTAQNSFTSCFVTPYFLCYGNVLWRMASQNFLVFLFNSALDPMGIQQHVKKKSARLITPIGQLLGVSGIIGSLGGNLFSTYVAALPPVFLHAIMDYMAQAVQKK
jgi:hypothetical protein